MNECDKLSNMKDFTLTIYMISRNTHSYYARKLKKLGITMGQFPFVMKIAENDGISQEKLSGKLAISKSNTALIIKQLLDLKLIEREVDANDRRNFKLHITERGKSLLPEIQKVIDQCHENLLNTLSAAEKKTLLSMLEKVFENSELI